MLSAAFKRLFSRPQTLDLVAKACRQFPDSTAISLGAECLSYQELWSRGQAIAAALSDAHSPVGLLYQRKLDDYAALLGIFLSGRSYVPLALNNQRVAQKTIETAGIETLLISQKSYNSQSLARQSNCDLCTIETLQGADKITTNASTQPAYILSSSGTSGPPKLIPISHKNLTAYISAAHHALDISPSDRMSQIFDLSFDLSLHDIFICWTSGATLVVPTPEERENLAEYVHARAITCWFSTPSHAEKTLARSSDPTCFSTLRLSMFCGEPLSWALVNKWQKLVPGCVENWYGPTETTIAATRYRVPEGPPQTNEALVPIGRPLRHMRYHLQAENELVLSGPQVFDGYLNAPCISQFATRDRVSEDHQKQLHFQVRLDQKIKLRGKFVDLFALQAALVAQTNRFCTVIAWPLKSTTPRALVGVIERSECLSVEEVTRLKKNEAFQGLPIGFLTVRELPLTQSGKLDQRALATIIEPKLYKAIPPKKRIDRLIAIALDINPVLSPDVLRSASNLMDAGLDSLAFTQFAAELEQQFDLSLSQENVSRLSQMNLNQILIFLRHQNDEKTDQKYVLPAPEVATRRLRKEPHYRAMRAVDFLDKFPKFLRHSQDETVPFIGSSGFMRAIEPEVIRKRAAQNGTRIQPVNLGMAMLSNQGIVEFCDFIARQAKIASVRFPISVLELEPLQLSVLPPAGDIEILKDYEDGVFQTIRRIAYDPDTQWEADHAGAIRDKQGPLKPKEAPARWESARHNEIRQIYDGEISFDPSQLDIWVGAIKQLLAVSNKVVLVLHPLDGHHSKITLKRGEFAQFFEKLNNFERLTLIDDTKFNLESSHFRNFSRVNAREGRTEFSRQLADFLFQ